MLFGDLIELNRFLMPSKVEGKYEHFIQRRNHDICRLAAKSQESLDAENKADRNPKNSRNLK